MNGDDDGLMNEWELLYKDNQMERKRISMCFKVFLSSIEFGYDISLFLLSFLLKWRKKSKEKKHK